MDFEDWRRSAGLGFTELGKRIGTKDSSATRYCKGRRVPAGAVMARIFVATGGQVEPNDFHKFPELARLVEARRDLVTAALELADGWEQDVTLATALECAAERYRDVLEDLSSFGAGVGR